MKRNGFTLIELLAVIVILAIIALIITPIILGTIDKANKNALKDSAYGLISAGKIYAAEQKLDGNAVTEDIEFIFPTDKIKVNGSVPDGTKLQINSKGEVALSMSNGRYCATKRYEDRDIVIDECKSNDAEKLCKLSDEDKNGKYSVGDIVTCTFKESTEQFYVIENEKDGETKEEISMLAMYNLYVGKRKYDIEDVFSYSVTPLENPTGIQNPLAKGEVEGASTWYGVVEFSTSHYWVDENDNLLPEYGSSSTVYVYNENSNLYQYVKAYETYLKENGVSSASATLISVEQLEDLGCPLDFFANCDDAPEWVYSTTYWTGNAVDWGGLGSPLDLLSLNSSGSLCNYYSRYGSKTGDYDVGVRPVVTILTSEI